MKQSMRRFAAPTCVAAVCCAFLPGATAQTALVQTQVGLERAVKTPAEIIWLKDEILAGLWRKNPLLDDTPGRCSDKRGAKETCTVGDQPAWRYIFGAGPLESRFKPLTSGVYLLSPRANGTGLMRAPTGEILLAAGTSVTLIDAAYPGIQIEVTAPPDQPLPLGNLAASDPGRMFGLLAKQPGVASASAASVLETGRVALKAEGEVQVAAVTRIPAAPPKETVKPIEVAMLAPPAPVVETLRADIPPPQLEFRGTIDTMKHVARAAQEPAAVVARSAQPLSFAGMVNVRAAARQEEQLKLDPGPMMAAAAPDPMPAPVPVNATPSAPVQLATVAPIPVIAEVPVLPAVVAAAPDPAPKAAPAREVQHVASATPDVARLRAEVEAEIERDRVRLVQLQQQSCSGIGRPMQGCTVATPKRFSFAG